jgi:hypothetical protein
MVSIFLISPSDISPREDFVQLEENLREVRVSFFHVSLDLRVSCPASETDYVVLF